MKNIFKKNTKSVDIKKGFTIIELIVVIAIIAVISALSIFNSSKLNSSVLLSNTAYEVGLIIRDAQVAGLGAKVLSDSVTGAATTSNQGVHIDMTNPEQIIFFADLDKYNSYSGTDEQSQVYNIQNKRAGKILKICKINSDTGACNAELVNKLNIIFKRPNPEAYFYTEDGLGSLSPYQGNVAVNMGFTNGECKSIIIYKTGAIQIDKSLCPPVQN